MAEAAAKDSKKDADAGESVPVTVGKHALMTEEPKTGKDSPDEKSDTKPDTSGAKPAPPSASRIKIQPISKTEDLKPDDAKTEANDATSSEPAATEDSTVDTDDESEGRDKLKDASQDEQELIDKKAAERQANLNKIALAKTYFLPINQVVRRRSKHVAIFGAAMALLLGLAWLDVSLDAGLITVPGVKPPTHFFSK